MNSFSITSVSNKQLVVVIDPGHGGKDPGAVNKNIREKDVVLGIGLKLGKLINDNHSDVKVIFTRNTDVFVPLIERSNIANKSKADLFISIHANFCSTPSTRGTETYALGLHRTKDNLEVAKNENSVITYEEGYKTTYEGFDPKLPESYIMFEFMQDEFLNQSLSFADAVQQQFKSHISTDNRGVKQAGFLVLRQSSMPSVLIESGFLSNQAEANYLNSEEGQQQIAASIFEAFKKFKGKNSGSRVAIGSPEVASTKKNSDTNTVDRVAVNKQSIASTNKKTDTDTVDRVVINKPAITNTKKNTDTNVVDRVAVNKQPVASTTKKTAVDTVDRIIINKPVITSTGKSKDSSNVEKQANVTQAKETKNENVEVVLASTEPLKVEPKKEIKPIKAEPEKEVKTAGIDKEKEIKTIKTDSVEKANGNNTYYCVQIAASTTPIKPVPDNFKGLKDIKSDKLDKFYRYYVGSESSLGATKQLLKQIKLKFPQAFIVSFVDGKRVPLY